MFKTAAAGLATTVLASDWGSLVNSARGPLAKREVSYGYEDRQYGF